jgi:hypothetical protein
LRDRDSRAKNSRMATAEELEWKRAQGSAITRIKPMLFGVLGAAIIGGGAFAGVYAYGQSSVKESQRLEAAGYEERCVDMRTHSSRPGPCHQEGIALFGLIAIAGGALGGFAVGFKAGGGKIATEYAQGAAQMMKR